MNAKLPSRLPRAELEPSGGEGPAQAPECEHTEQEIEPEVDGDLGALHDFNDEQANANPVATAHPS